MIELRQGIKLQALAQQRGVVVHASGNGINALMIGVIERREKYLGFQLKLGYLATNEIVQLRLLRSDPLPCGGLYGAHAHQLLA